MEIQEIVNNREKEIARFELRLGVEFPHSYRCFLLEQGSAVINGYRILGIPREEKAKEEERLDLNAIAESASCPVCKKQKSVDKITCYNCYNRYSRETNRQSPLSLWVKENVSLQKKKEEPKEKGPSVLRATQHLREMRPDLSEKLVAICINRERVLCLDTEQETKEDCPLIDVSLKKEEVAKSVGNTFKEWLKIHQGYTKRFNQAYSRVQRRRKETEERKDRKFGGKKGLLPRSKDWHPIVSEVQDYIVGLTAVRFNPHYNRVEVDEFYALDHPRYKPGGAIRNLANIVFTMARDFSGSLNVVFTDERRDGKQNFFRPTRPVPKELVELAEQYGITFEKAAEGRVSHKEGVKLFFAILEFSPKIQEIVAKLEEANYLNREMITEIIATGTIWSREEVIWLLENTSRPEAVVLGTDLPENRVFHADSLNYGRSVLLAKRFQRVVLNEITDGFSSEERALPRCNIEPKGKFWILKSAKRFNLPWMMRGEEKVGVESEESILVLSRPRIISGMEENHNWIKENIVFLETEKNRIGIRLSCLILNYEFISRDFEQDVKKVKEIAREAAQKGIYLLFPYDRCDQLDLEVEEKMRRARRMRQFPVCAAQLELRVIEIPKTQWQVKEKFGHVARNAYDYGRLVANKVNTTRYRNDFIITSAAVERMALQYPKRKTKPIIELLGKESQEVLEALRSENGITCSFVIPDEMPQFLKRLSKETQELLKDVQGGIVVIGAPYKKVEVSRKKPRLSRVRLKLPASFTAEIDKQVEERIQDKVYVSRDVYLKSVHQQIREALDSGLPLAVSYLQPQVFVETIRDYIYYHTLMEKREVRFLWFFKRWKSYEKKEPEKPAYLRIVYNDGSEGGLFPLFSLSEDVDRQRKLYELPAQLVSLRHMLADYATECSIIRNAEIQRKEDSAEQEEFAFRKVYFFIETLLKLISREVSIEEVEKTARIFRLLWEYSDTTEGPIKKSDPQAGLRLQLFQSSGLEPAVAGAYRAAVELLKKYQGRLVVVPRIYRPNGNLKEEFKKLSIFDMTGKRKIVSKMYSSAQEWY